MKNRYTLKNNLLIALVLLLLIKCGTFDDINNNPDQIAKVSPSLLTTSVILRVTKFSGRDAKAMISDNAFSKYVGYALEGQLPAQYNSIGGSSFSNMTILPNIEQLVIHASGSPMENSYRGVAKFARSKMFYSLTMQMGDIPYRETNKGAVGLYKPKYDEQIDVLIGILDELKEADAYFASGIPFAGDPTPYNGDPVKWRRATNAFALKILMTLSKQADNSKLNVKKRFADIVANGFLLEASTGFFGLNYSGINKHPLSSTNDQFTKRTIVSSLLIDHLKRLNDRRLFYYAEPAGAELSKGKLPSDMAAYVGVDVAMDYAKMNAGYSANLFSQINTRYVKEFATEPIMWLTFAEQQLILAEARLRGWITVGSAKDYYEQGVAEALRNAMKINDAYVHGMSISESYIQSYFTGDAAFNTTGSMTNQLKQIWIQRYILNFMQDSESVFFDYRRNTYPDFPINPLTSLNENNKNAIPMRWLYPSSESNYNREKLIEALERQYEGYDEINKIMWVLK